MAHASSSLRRFGNFTMQKPHFWRFSSVNLRHLEWFFEKMADIFPFFNFRGGLLSAIFSRNHSNWHSKIVKSGFYMVKFQNLLRLGLACAPHLTKNLSQCVIYMHSKPTEKFFLNFKDFNKMTKNMLQNYMIWDTCHRTVLL